MSSLPYPSGKAVLGGGIPKRLEKGRFIWPSPSDGVLAISASQLAYMLDGIDWRNPVRSFRPERAG